MMTIRHWAALLIVVLVAVATPAFAFSLPDRNGWVTDDAAILDADTADTLALRLSDLQRDTGAEVVVVTLRDLQGATIEAWGDALRRRWGVGRTNGQDTGVLLIVAPNDRKVRIAVGYGLGNRIPDAVAASIISDHILPYFRQGNFARGVNAGIDSIALELDRNAGARTSAVERSPAPLVVRQSFLSWLRAELTPSQHTLVIGFWVLVFLFVFALMVLNAGNVGSGRRWGRRYYDDDDDYGSSWHNHSSSGSSWGSSSGSSSSSSGGGSSSGGATGSW